MARKKKKEKEEPINPDEVMEVSRGIRETIRLEEARGCKFKPALGPSPNVRITPLEILKSQNQITYEQYGAGEVYGRLYKYAHFYGNYKCGLARFDDVRDNMFNLGAMSAVVRAQRRIGDPFQIHQANRVCGLDMTPNDFLGLRDALSSLAELYYKGRANRKTA